MDKPLKSVTHGQCDARPMVTLPATEHHRPLAGTTLYCLVTEAHGCQQLAQSCCLAVHRPGVEPGTSRSRVQHANHYTTKPPHVLGRQDIKNWTSLEKHGKSAQNTSLPIIINSRNTRAIFTMPDSTFSISPSPFICIHFPKKFGNSVGCHTRDVTYSKTIFSTAMLSTTTSSRSHSTKPNMV